MANSLCRICGEDYRSWFSRLTQKNTPIPLISQEKELQQLLMRVQQARRKLEAEIQRVRNHQAATPAGRAVLEETLAKLEQGLKGLSYSEGEIQEKRLQLMAARGRLILEAVRSEAEEPVTALEGRSFKNHISGAGAAILEEQAVFWSAARPLQPSWKLPSGPLSLLGPPEIPLIKLGKQLYSEEGTPLLELPEGSRILADTPALLIALPTEQGCQIQQLELPGLKLLQEIALDAMPVAGWLLPEGRVLLQGASGISVWEGGQKLASYRSGNLLTVGQSHVLSFPMLLSLPKLEPVTALTRPTTGGFSRCVLGENGLIIGYGPGLVFWRLDEPNQPYRLDLPEAVHEISFSKKLLEARCQKKSYGIRLSPWPPTLGDSWSLLELHALQAPEFFPPRFYLTHEGRLDRAHASWQERVRLCHQLAAWALNQPFYGPETAQLLHALARDALVVEAEVVLKAAQALAVELASLRAEASAFEQPDHIGGLGNDGIHIDIVGAWILKGSKTTAGMNCTIQGTLLVVKPA
jgi:hypothetical protein